MEQKERIISGNFILLFFVSIAVCIGMNMLNVIVPLYVTETLRGTAGTAGLMTTVYTIAACASRPLNGVLTDRLGRRNIMFAGALLFSIACLACGLIPAILALAIWRVLMGVGYSAATTANNTASTDVIPASRLTEGVGYFGMSQSVASAFGPALASVVLAAMGNQRSLLVVAGVGAVACVLSMAVRYESAPGYQRPEKSAKSGGFFEKTALLPALFQGLSLFLISCLMCFMALYIVSRGLSASVAGSFFAVASVVIVTVRLLGARWLSRFPTQVFLVCGYVLLIAACVLLPLVGSVPGILGVGLLYGAAHGVIWMTLGSEAVRLAPPERRGAANATFYFAFDAAIGLGAAFWGSMIDYVGYNVCFGIIAVAAALLAVGSVIAFRRRS